MGAQIFSGTFKHWQWCWRPLCHRTSRFLRPLAVLRCFRISQNVFLAQVECTRERPHAASKGETHGDLGLQPNFLNIFEPCGPKFTVQRHWTGYLQTLRSARYLRAFRSVRILRRPAETRQIGQWSRKGVQRRVLIYRLMMISNDV